MSYSSDGQENNQDSIVTVPSTQQELQHVSNEALALTICNVPCVDDNDIINIQLPYDPDWSTKPNLWNSSFRYISLYSLLEHLPFDARCIKTFLVCIAKYIKDKKINSFKVNEVKDLQGISKAA